MPSFAAKTSLLVLVVFFGSSAVHVRELVFQPGCAMVHAAAVLCAVWAWSPQFFAQLGC